MESSDISHTTINHHHTDSLIGRENKNENLFFLSSKSFQVQKLKLVVLETIVYPPTIWWYITAEIRVTFMIYERYFSPIVITIFRCGDGQDCYFHSVVYY